MCGILLYISKKKISYKKFRDSLELMNHRGPDNTSIISYVNNNFNHNSNSDFDYNFLIGHKRLSIIDLSEKSNQPFINNENKNFFLYNGEFYNYKNYSNEFTQNSDALTFFDLLNKNSSDAFKKINGMWGAVYGDMKNNNIIISRDLYGKKPLYYFLSEETLIISSEVKSIHNLLNMQKKINTKALSMFLCFKFSPFLNDGETFYKNIKSVKPGEVLSINLLNLKISSKQIDFPDNLKTQNIMENDLLNNFINDFSNSIKYRLQSDVKIGVNLSGGIDSSLITSFIKNSRTDVNYYVAYDSNRHNDAQDDLFYARLVAKEYNLNLIEIPISYSYQDDLLVLEKLSSQFEIPVNFASTPYPTYLISKKMSEDGVKVSIDGIGADEILGYYPKYLSLSIANFRTYQIYNSLKFLQYHLSNSEEGFFRNCKDLIYMFYKGILKSSPLNHEKNINFYDNIIDNFSLKKSIYNTSKEINREKLTTLLARQKLAVDTLGIPFYVGVADQVSMMHSIENRSPFLDKNIYKYIHLDEKYKIKNGYNKYLLRKILSQKISKNIAWRKTKKGFTNFNTHKFLYDKRNLEYVLDDSFVRSIVNINELQKSIINPKNYRDRFLLSMFIPLASLNKKLNISI